MSDKDLLSEDGLIFEKCFHALGLDVTGTDAQEIPAAIQALRAEILDLKKESSDLILALQEVALVTHDINTVPDTEARYNAFDIASKALKPLGYEYDLSSKKGDNDV
jgi:hypothetical protein